MLPKPSAKSESVRSVRRVTKRAKVVAVAGSSRHTNCDPLTCTADVYVVLVHCFAALCSYKGPFMPAVPYGGQGHGPRGGVGGLLLYVPGGVDGSGEDINQQRKQRGHQHGAPVK
jgi:hypothetical protein